jgi:2'-5' RNA ligase
MPQFVQSLARPGAPPREGIPETRPTDRLLFAVYPEPQVAATRIAPLAQRLRSELNLRGKPIATERLHATVHFLGDYAALPPDLVSAARAAGSALRMAPFEVTFDRVASFNNRSRNRPLVLKDGGTGSGASSSGLVGGGIRSLRDFHHALGEALLGVGLGRWASPVFTPHVTLLYDDRAVEETPVEDIGWTVREFVLVHSLLGGGRHVALARWPLTGHAD